MPQASDALCHYCFQLFVAYWNRRWSWNPLATQRNKLLPGIRNILQSLQVLRFFGLCGLEKHQQLLMMSNLSSRSKSTLGYIWLHLQLDYKRWFQFAVNYLIKLLLNFKLGGIYWNDGEIFGMFTCKFITLHPSFHCRGQNNESGSSGDGVFRNCRHRPTVGAFRLLGLLLLLLQVNLAHVLFSISALSHCGHGHNTWVVVPA